MAETTDTGRVASPEFQRKQERTKRIKLAVSYGTPVLTGLAGVYGGNLLAKKFFPTQTKLGMIGGLIAGLAIGYYGGKAINEKI